MNEKLLSWLKTGKIQETLDYLIVIIKDKDNQMYTDLVLLASRQQANQRMFNLNLIPHENLNIESNNIFKSVLDCVNQASDLGYFEGVSWDDIEEKKNQPEDVIKILFVASNPINTPKFQIEKEYLEIRKIFSTKRKKFDITESFNTTLDGLFDVVRTEKPEILHLSAPSTDQYLVLHRQDDTIRSVMYDFLSAVFPMFQPYVKCVFINTWCSPIFLKKISIPLHRAIGGKTMVIDEASIIFSSGFYTAIAQGKKWDEAFYFGNELLSTWIKRNELPFEMPYVCYVDGVSNEPEDTTPADFPVIEPEEIEQMRRSEKD